MSMMMLLWVVWFEFVEPSQSDSIIHFIILVIEGVRLNSPYHEGSYEDDVFFDFEHSESSKVLA